MKILQLSTFDGRFGASIAARRLHEALLASDQESDLLVSEVIGDSPRTHGPRSGLEKFTAKVRHHLDESPLRLYPQRSAFGFSPNWVPSPISRRVAGFNSDVVHMHWCQSDFVPTGSLPQLGRALIWTFHDMWAFTGGCHYTSGCQRYRSQCGRCPILNSTSEYDLSRWLWQQKQSVYQRIKTSLQIICPSNWLAGIARNAPLLEGIPVHTVPNPINTRVFKPIDKMAARRLLGLPDEGRLLLWGATSRGDHRKGFDLLDEALLRYAAQPDALPLGIVTLGMRSSAAPANPRNLQTWNIGFLHDEASLAALYNAVDVVALPSREENLSNTLAEALCCGTPCLAFRIGGNADLISHQKNGYLAHPDDTDDMAIGLTWILNHLRDEQRASIAREAQEKLAAEKLIPTFLNIYRSALGLPQASSSSSSSAKKVTYITPAKVDDRYAWSGLAHFMAFSLKSSGLNVEIIDSLQFPSQLWPERILRKMTYESGVSGRHMWLFDPRLSKAHAEQVNRRIDQSPADIIFTSGTVQMALLKSSRPIVFWTDATFACLLNYYFSDKELDEATLRHGHELERAAIQNARLGIYSSSWAADSAVRDYQMDPARLHTVPFGANLKQEPKEEEVARFIEERPTKPCRLLFIGVEWKRKGGDIALALVERLRKEGLPCELTIVGCQIPHHIQLPSQVKTVGFINKFSEEGAKFLEKLYAESHFFILPSRADCTPIVFSEANCYGVPILSTETGGIPSIVKNGVNGFCIPMDNDLLSKLTGQVLATMSNADAYRKLAQSSRREYVHRLNWKTSGQRTRELILDCLNK